MGFSEAIIKIGLFIIIFLSLFLLSRAYSLNFFFFFFTFNYFLGKLMKKLYLKTIKNFNSKNFIEIMKRSMDVYRNECFGTFYIPFCSKFRTFRSTNAAIFYFTSSHRSPRMNNFQLCSCHVFNC